jgi:hypothetical protein
MVLRIIKIWTEARIVMLQDKRTQRPPSIIENQVVGAVPDA